MTYSMPVTGNVPTVFVGVVHEEYTDALWENHYHQLGRLFEITSNDYCCHIKVTSIGPDSMVVDIEKLKDQMTTAMNAINIQFKDTTLIRIVGLGKGFSPVITDALEALIRGWDIPSDQKSVQFIALGESANFHYLNFCKGLVMKKVCKNLQYYNTMDYNSFGYLQSGHQHMITPENLQQILQAMVPPSAELLRAAIAGGMD